MRCLSLYQPWASLMADGRKRVETRSWPPRFSGPLLIHASKAWTGKLADTCLESPFRTALQGYAVPPPQHRWTHDDLARKRRGYGLPFGVIVGRVRLLGCWPTEQVMCSLPNGTDAYGHYFGPGDGGNRLFVSVEEKAFGDYSPGRFAWLTTDAVQFADPIPVRGRQGLFEVPDALLREGR